MVRFLGVASVLCAVFWSHGASADDEKRGLSTTTVNGVLVTRGHAYTPQRSFPSEAKRARTSVNLDRKYRGSVFGQHKIVKDGRHLLREQLLPIRQRTDE